MAWIVPALAATLTTAGLSATAASIATGAIVGAGISGVAAGAMSLANGQTPWDDPGGFFAAQGKAIGLGAAGGALGPALGAAGESLGIGSNVGTSAAGAGAPSGGVGISGNPIGSTAITALKAGANGAEGIGAKLSGVGINIGKQALSGAIAGTFKDMQHPLRGALVGAAGGTVGGGLSFAGQATGILPTQPAANFQPTGDMGYSADSASVMPPQPGYTSSGFGPSLGSRALASAGQLGVQAGQYGARQAVGNAMTPPPPQAPVGTYQSFGIKPYWEQGPFA